MTMNDGKPNPRNPDAVDKGAIQGVLMYAHDPVSAQLLPVPFAAFDQSSTLGPWVGDQALTVSAAPVALTVPANATAGVIEGQVADVRFRFGGLTPDATTGHDLNVGDRVFLSRDELLMVRFVRAGGADGRVMVDYHGALP